MALLTVGLSNRRCREFPTSTRGPRTFTKPRPRAIAGELRWLSPRNSSWAGQKTNGLGEAITGQTRPRRNTAARRSRENDAGTSLAPMYCPFLLRHYVHRRKRLHFQLGKTLAHSGFQRLLYRDDLDDARQPRAPLRASQRSQGHAQDLQQRSLLVPPLCH